jgi:thioredoxin reductase
LSRYDVIVGGGGAAGLSAALFLARAKATVAVFDMAESSLRRVRQVNNYLGFPDGISGSGLLDRGRRQAEKFGAVMMDDRIRTVAWGNELFAITAESGAEHQSAYFVLASNKRTDLATSLGLELGGFGGRFVSVDQHGATAVERLYAAGRITGKPSQAVVSAGDGANVAISIVQRMRGEYYVDHDT